MPADRFITVTAPDGILTPVAPDDGTNPNGGIMRVEPGVVQRVRISTATLRSIGRGDLIPCDKDGKPVAAIHMAEAPDDLDEPHGIVVREILARDGTKFATRANPAHAELVKRREAEAKKKAEADAKAKEKRS